MSGSFGVVSTSQLSVLVAASDVGKYHEYLHHCLDGVGLPCIRKETGRYLMIKVNTSYVGIIPVGYIQMLAFLILFTHIPTRCQ